MEEIHRPRHHPTHEQFVVGLGKIWGRLTETQRQLLIIQYSMPDNRISATQFAAALKLSSHGIANRQYAQAAEKFCKSIDYIPDVRDDGGPRWWAVWSYGLNVGKGRFDWVMHPELAQALESLQYVDPDGIRLPEEALTIDTYREGMTVSVTVNRYERNQNARDRCIEIYGTTCVACDMNFKEAFGDEWAGLIHIHHLAPLAAIRDNYDVVPVDDLRPVCPNCHAMIHWKSGCRSIDYIRDVVSKTKRRTQESP